MSLADCTANILLLCMLARCGVVRVRGCCGVWRTENGAALGWRTAHITALGHSQATTLTLAVATSAHCHKVWMDDEHEKCNYLSKNN